MSSNKQNQNQPSLVGGHAEYVKGAAEVSSPSPPPLSVRNQCRSPTHFPFPS